MDTNLAARLWQQLWHGLRDEHTPVPQIVWQGHDAFCSVYPVSELAAASIALAAQAAAALTGNPAKPRLDAHLASRWFQHSFRPINRPLPPAGMPSLATTKPPMAGSVCIPMRRTIASRWSAYWANSPTARRWRGLWRAGKSRRWNRRLSMRAAVPQRCAALRRGDSIRRAKRGAGAADRPAIAGGKRAARPALPIARPLHGVRVLDLTRVIAGPVATRFLAGLGAEVLRLDPPDWEEPTLEEEMMLGKRCARLDLKSDAGRQQFERLLMQTDVLVHGYRADALEALGYDSARLQQLAPCLIDVSLNARGWSGPWRNRRGFDSWYRWRAASPTPDSAGTAPTRRSRCRYRRWITPPVI